MHVTAEVSVQMKRTFQACHRPLRKQAQGFCLSVHVLTFFPFFFASPDLEVCGGGGPVIHSLATLLVVCLSLALSNPQLSNILPRVREQTGSTGGPVQGG